jgi:hypothetical protein
MCNWGATRRVIIGKTWSTYVVNDSFKNIGVAKEFISPPPIAMNLKSPR